MKNLKTFLGFFISLIPIAGVASFATLFESRLQAVEIHLSQSGKDSGDGSELSPLASFEKAKALVKTQRQKQPAESVIVVVHEGLWNLPNGLSFDASDSGSADFPIIWRAFGEGKVILNSSRLIPMEKLRGLDKSDLASRVPAASRGRIKTVNLQEIGIAHAGPYPDQFIGRGGVVDVLWGDKRLALSRFPKTGYATMKRVIDKGVWQGDSKHGGIFEFNEDEILQWNVEDGIWLDGFWRVPWDNQSLRVARIDQEKRTITFKLPVFNGIGSKYAGPEGSGKENWCRINALESLTEPGEWAIHFPSQTLLIYPPENDAGPLFICDEDRPVLSVRQSSNLIFEGFEIRGSLGNGVEIIGGQNVFICGATVRLCAGNGAVLEGGFKNRIDSCDLFDLGEGGVLVSGGRRRELIPSDHQILNCDIHHFARIKKTYAPGLGAGYAGSNCVGLYAAHNRIHDTPHAGVLYGGNENRFEYNELYRLALDSHDVGGFYSWNDWSDGGNVIRYNLIHSSPVINGVYIDDGESGTSVLSNIFWRVDVGTFISGGHRNLVSGNLMVSCRIGAHLDSRGISRKYEKDTGLLRKFKTADVESPVWAVRYPELKGLLEDHPEKPSRDEIRGNIFMDCSNATRLSGKPGDFDRIVSEPNQSFSNDPVYADVFVGKKSWREVPETFGIPFEKIGLYTNAYRRKLSPRVDPGLDPVEGSFRSEADLEKSNRK